MDTLILDATNKSLRAVLDGAHAANPVDFTVHYADVTDTPSITEGSNAAQSNGVTNVEILAAPAASTRRIVRNVTVVNRDTISHTVSIFMRVGATDYAVTQKTLAAGASWAFGESGGSGSGAGGDMFKSTYDTDNDGVVDDAEKLGGALPSAYSPEIHAATSKTTPVDADELGLWDSVVSAFKKLTWANLKATLKTYFDTLYSALGHTHSGLVTNGDSHDHVGGDGAAIAESAISLSDVTTGDVSITKHGFAPKAPNDTTKFLRGDATWAQPTSPLDYLFIGTSTTHTSIHISAPNYNSLSVGANTIWYVPFWFASPRTLSKLGVYVKTIGTSGVKMRMGLYNNNQGAPSSLLLDAGEIAGDALGEQLATISQAVAVGWLWIAMLCQSVATQPQIWAPSNVQPVMGLSISTGALEARQGVKETYTYGTLPANAGTLTWITTNGGYVPLVRF